MATNSYTNEELLRGLLAGSQDACVQIERWAGDVVRSQRYGIPASERADLIQETLRRTWELVRTPDFELKHSLRALVYRIAQGHCINWLRRRRVSVELQEDLLRVFPNPEERLDRERLIERLHSALHHIKPFCRDLIRWRFYESLTFKDIADATGRNAATLAVHVFKCVSTLRTLMKAPNPQ